jgi:TPR repeat protein
MKSKDSKQLNYDLSYLARAGNAEARLVLSELGLRAEEDIDDILRRALGGGSTIAKLLLANRLWSANTVENKDEILSLLREAHVQGNAVATNSLAYATEIGMAEGGQVQAIELYLISARAGYLPAIEYVALAFYSGNWGDANRAKSLDWHRKGSELGSGNCAYMLSLAYRSGEIVKVDLNEAQFWLDRAAELEDENALNELSGFSQPSK